MKKIKLLTSLVLVGLALQFSAFAQDVPYSVTDSIINPNFELDGNRNTSITGWDNPNEFQTQENTSFIYKNATYYCEKWQSTGGWQNIGISQTIKNMPVGIYKMTAACHNSATTGLFLYANKNQVEITGSNNYKLVFETTSSDKGTIVLGMKADSSGNYICIDNVELTYCGSTYLNIIIPLIDSAETIITNDAAIPDGSTAYTDLQTAIDRAKAFKDAGIGSIEEIDAECEALEDAIAEANAAIILAERIESWQPTPYDISDETLDGDPSFERGQISSIWVNQGGFKPQSNDSFEKDGKWYVERWRISTSGGWKPSDNMDIHTDLKGLPNGVYTITATARAIDQRDDSYPGNCFVYADADGNHYSKEVFNTADYGTALIIKNNELTVGFQVAGDTTGNYISIDNFRLAFYGTDPDLSQYLISSLSSNIGEFTPEFDPEVDEYTAKVPYGTDGIIFDGKFSPAFTNETYIDINGIQYKFGDEIPIPDGTTNMEATLMFVDFRGEEYEYTIVIEVSDGLDDATMTGITVKADDGFEFALDPVFETDEDNYVIVVPQGTSNVNVEVSTNYPEATVAGAGKIALTDGVATTQVIVTSKDGSAKDTATINISTADGKNYALSLPGGSGDTSNVDISGLAIDTVPYTMELWFKPEGKQVGRTGLIFGREEGSSNDNGGIQYNENGGLTGVANTGTDYEGIETGTAYSGDWHHVAFVVEDSSRTIYLDGVKTTQEDLNTVIDYSASTLKTYLGYDNAGSSRAFAGLIDEVRVWNDVRTEQEIIDSKYEVLKGDEANLVSYYNFDLNSPTRAVDIATSNNNGVITGGSYVESFSRVNLEVDTIYLDNAKLVPAFAKGLTEYHTVFPIGTTSTVVTAVKSASSVATLNGVGNVSIDAESGTITVTASNGDDSEDYVIHYLVEQELTLTHSYTFSDGTAKDVKGNADGVFVGDDITVFNGVATTTALNSYIDLDAKAIGINKYPSVSVEMYFNLSEETPNTGDWMFWYLGDTDSTANVGWNYLMGNAKGCAVSCGSTTEPWTTDNSCDLNSIAESYEDHHLVITLSMDSIKLFIDGGALEAVAVTDENKIFNLGDDFAYILNSGYPADKTCMAGVYEFNIYKGVMDQETAITRGQKFPVENNAPNATLRYLTADGDTLADFHATDFDYTVVLDYGVDTVPTLVGIPVCLPTTDTTLGATVTVDQVASTIEGTTIITVESEDKANKYTYNITFTNALDPSNATLTDLTVDGETIEGFRPDSFKYVVDVLEGAAMPTIAYTAYNGTVKESLAKTVNDTTTLTVTAEDDTTVLVYTITYNEYAGINDNNEVSAVSVYPTVSDGTFTIATAEKAEVTIFTLTGKVVKRFTTTSDKQTFTLKDSQMYLVRVDTESGTEMFKVLKK